MKGLGSMCKTDWEMILSEKSDTLIPFVDDGSLKPIMELLFGDSSDLRKAWLMADS